MYINGATTNIISDGEKDASIKFAQIPGHAVQVRGVFGSRLNVLTDSITLVIKETGIIWGDEKANEPGALSTNVRRCGKTFSDKEFNPMQAIDKYGNQFTHQDP